MASLSLAPPATTTSQASDEGPTQSVVLPFVPSLSMVSTPRGHPESLMYTVPAPPLPDSLIPLAARIDPLNPWESSEYTAMRPPPPAPP